MIKFSLRIWALVLTLVFSLGVYLGGNAAPNAEMIRLANIWLPGLRSLTFLVFLRYPEFVISKNLDELSGNDFDELIANSVPEGKTVEYKLLLPGNSDADRKEFLADVSSFANTSGGDIIYGVDESQGVPTALPGLSLENADLEVRRLDSIISNGLEPRIRHSIRVIKQITNLPLVIVRVERSWIGPHRVTFKGHDMFYARNSAGKYSLDVSELRSAFSLANSVTDRVRRFRSERIEKIQSEESPVSLGQGKSKIVLHCIPFESFAAQVQYPVLNYLSQTAKIPPINNEGGWSHRINLEGLVTFTTSHKGPLSYSQLFRSGAIEGVEGHWLNVEYQGRRTIPYAAVEGGLLKYLSKSFEIQQEPGYVHQ